MAEITTTKKINVSQLCHEIGGKSLHVLQDEKETRITFDGRAISQADMEAAISAHKASGTWKPPAGPPSQADQDRTRKAELAEKPVLTPTEQQEAIKLYLKGV